MIKVPIKPITINSMYADIVRKTKHGKSIIKRIKTINGKLFEFQSSYFINKKELKDKEFTQLEIIFIFAFSNIRQDIDSCLKPALDTLQNCLGFNDNKVYSIIIKKEIVKKGSEYWAYKINIIL